MNVQMNRINQIKYINCIKRNKIDFGHFSGLFA